MVKGIAKNAVILQAHGKKEYEQVIFIVPPGTPVESVSSPQEMLELADNLAEKCKLTTKPKSKKSWVGPFIGFICGVLVTVASTMLLFSDIVTKVLSSF